jgi:hypothetical protein
MGLLTRIANGLRRRLETISTTESSEIHRRIDELAAAIDRLVTAQEHESKWRANFRRDLQSVLRHVYADELVSPHGFALNARRFRVRSQNEEDGITLALLKAAGVRDYRFVEIGSGRSGGNSAVLAFELGWEGLMVDASRSAVEAACRTFAINPRVQIVCAAVSVENINTLVTEAGFTGDIDFLSLDVDSYDYWLFEALTACTPRVLVLEYNSLFGADRAVTIPYDAPLKGAPKGYAGASLAALEKLASRKGYRLVGCENSGVNAFFVRHDLAAAIPTLSAVQAFRPSLSRSDPTGEGLREFDIFRVAKQKRLPLVEV